MAFVAEGGFEMARKRHKSEEIVAKLRQVDVLTSQGQSVVAKATTWSGSRRWMMSYAGNWVMTV
jgi:putative transposase